MITFCSPNISKSEMKRNSIDEVLKEEIELLFKIYAINYLNHPLSLSICMVEDKIDYDDVKENIVSSEFSNDKYTIFNSCDEEVFYIIPNEFKMQHN